ncbi:hypothetical protein [Pseudonocardia phyllosphaerae]|uniref:hypothetical protein n=1 Tax=Pseudonocardia phyllosphaerae TaxID=3390502 RepID=UPI00397B68A0
MNDALDAEWNDYEDACERLDLWRWSCGHDAADTLERQLYLAEQRVKIRDTAINASSRLIDAASQDPDIDPDWLADVLRHHEILVKEREGDQRLLGQIERDLRPQR